MLPTVVPRLRIVGCATFTSAWRSSGTASKASRSRSTSACRANAPTRTPPGSVRTYASSASRLMSTRCPGAASRMFSTGTRLWPPASTLPSAPTSASTVSASVTVDGRWYSNGGGFIP